MLANALAAVALTYTTFAGPPAPVEQPAPAAFTYEASGDLGWVLTQEGIAPDHECVIHLSVQPYRAIVVADSDPLCEAEAVQFTAGLPA